ncbi:hypothetical protein LBMAG42_08610 [Deltaproteobacteria bacterium]|nr:hypothetical protein LBMAG42_08610 [Deltaproteobacteria bacterium]
MAHAARRFLVPGLLTAVALGVPLAAYAANLSGAIFTTNSTGTVVNENTQYTAKTDVYLDGGPGPNAPASAAGLPAGDYYYQVTDPSGKDLLSTDNISCRKVHVNSAGVISQIYSGLNYSAVKGLWTGTACTHTSNTDTDHASAGAKTVQLYPFDDTPNLGGVYKVWLTPTSSYTGSTAGCSGKSTSACNNSGELYSSGNYHGFVSSQSKTDNFKVVYKGKTFTAPYVTVSKFHDANANGVQDSGESSVTGWAVDATDNLGVTNTLFTAATLTAYTAGAYSFTESTPAGTAQTVAYKDGAVQSSYPTASATVSVTIAGTSGETHSVVYGNVGLGSFDACKVFDRNGNGVQDADEALVEGWQFTLSGTTVLGGAVGSTQLTDASGCASWEDLLPGTYTVTEGTETSGEWTAIGATSSTQVITSTLSGSSMSGTAAAADYTNQRWLVADFGTKGYWHNQNGLAELTQDNIDAVNVLDPYSSSSDYSSSADEPFDGYLASGAAVCTETVGADCGTGQAEVSEFLTEDNGTGTHEEQLAQQLLAFIFNVQHRLDDGGAYVVVNGGLISADDLVADAIYIWNYGSDAEVVAMQELLESFNSSDAVSYVPVDPGTPAF